MRRARWLILAAITIIVFAVGATYYERLARMARETPAPPTPLRAGIDASAALAICWSGADASELQSH